MIPINHLYIRKVILMKRLNIDIETYSEADLLKSGVYRYVDDPGFEVLLFGFSVDGGPVRVIDLARGEKLPAEIIEALSDDGILKYAFNAQFERVCLGKYLGVYLAPEGTNYRAKTRFAKFYNLPELMQMFREVADIQTADMLKLPVPKVNYHNIKTKPSEIQTEMVASLAKRAEKVRARLVEPNIDNMLKITNDGRKLALDQRMIDPMLPDDPDSKVNACVDNVYRIWEEHADTKATQLVFCDLSTPKNDGTFNVYDDIREKLIARGIPAEQIRFIHEATTDAQKKELFGKVRSGEVRVLFGSTPKMGAGTNVQDRLIAIHNLDCPWRPSDVGRILRTFKIKKNVEVTDNGKIII